MNPAAMQEIVTKGIDAFNRHDADAFAALYSAEATAYDPQSSEPLKGREAIRKDIEDFFYAFPDVQQTVVNTVVTGDTVAVEGQITGTHKGPFVTPGGPIPATNRRMEMRIGRFIRVDAQGRITECNRYYDMAGIMQQLGLM